MKHLKNRIIKLDKEIINITTKLNRANRRLEQSNSDKLEPSDRLVRFADYDSEVVSLQMKLKALEKEKAEYIQTYCELAAQKEAKMSIEQTQDDLAHNDNCSIVEEYFKLSQMQDDLESILFAYTCMISAKKAQISIGIEYETKTTAEIFKEQEYLTSLQNKQTKFNQRLQQVKQRLEIVKVKYDEISYKKNSNKQENPSNTEGM